MPREPHVDPSELVAFARDRLADFKAPRHMQFVSELPRSAMGKVLKRELAALRTS